MAEGQERQVTGELPLMPLPESQQREQASAEESHVRKPSLKRKAEKAEQEDAKSFTPEEIDDLIGEARERALGIKGSTEIAASVSSQVSQSFMHDSSLCNHEAVCRPTLGSLGDEIITILKNTLNDDVCRSKPSIGSKDLFPLPVSRCVEFSSKHPTFLRCLASSLNSLCGVEEAARTRHSEAAVRVMKSLGQLVDELPYMDESLPDLDFDSFFMNKKVDYEGEEISVAKTLTWRSISPSLPDEVGQLFLRDYCEGGVLHFIDHFEQYLMAPEDRCVSKPPRVFVEDSEWEELATGLVQRGLCEVVRESQLCHIDNKILVNGLFSVSKNEFQGDIEICRLIMNLRPLNAISRSLTGDTATLPSITSLTNVVLEEDQLLSISSEDVRCFFYLFRTPEAWWPYMGFGREVPESLKGSDFGSERGFLTARVLPMGYLNSVGIAQHIHRNVIRRAMGDLRPPLGHQLEMRRDRPFSQSDHLIRIYLDNFDELVKVDRQTAELIKGTPSRLVKQVRETYLDQGLPRHPKKGVESNTGAEVQGAWINGERGIATAKPAKIVKYVQLGLEAIRRGVCSQKELQVIGGGFVYICMFRRPLLSGLNQIWRQIVELEGCSGSKKVPLKREVAHEIARFIGLTPLAFINFRTQFDGRVTASDASTSGGGVCVSRGLTPYGAAASLSTVRGDLPEQQDCDQILSVGLFDGIGGLRVALDALHLPIAGHISVESNEAARRVVESFFPDTIAVTDISHVTAELCKEWALRFSGVCLVLIGAGPPCQGVSGLNSDRKGALKDARSKLFKHVIRIVELFRAAFPWAQIHYLVENVASMDYEDCLHMNDSYGFPPWFIDASGVSLCNRPRLYWPSWDLVEGEGITMLMGSDGTLPIQGEVRLQGEVHEKDFLESGWKRVDEGRSLPTFTTARPSEKPLRRPAGLATCSPEEKLRWAQDKHKFPPYQYRDQNGLVHSSGEIRTPSVQEREVILGYPVNYTKQCLKKQLHGSEEHVNCRLTLLGNSWSIPVVTWIISCLVSLLGFCEPVSLQEIIRRLCPGAPTDLQSLLLRPPLGHSTKTLSCSTTLVRKLAGLTSLKGEDLLLQSHTDVPTRYHRLRASVPAKLWRWSTVAGWKWEGSSEHINVLELRSVLTTIKWRVEQLKQSKTRFIHLVDSQVVLHALSRGRSSSRKMRRTLMRLCAYVLASGLVPIWGYVDTHQNPADRPSRRFVKKRWLKKS